MAERIVNGYQRLFEVRILHHYWLDEGSTLFDAIPDQFKKDRRLLTYDLRPFLQLQPTDTTEKLIQGLQGVFKATALGGVVVIPKAVVVPNDAIFEFVVMVQSSDFFNYTASTFRRQKIYELYHQPEDKIYRYKEGAFVFSNQTGIKRGSDLYLSQEVPNFSAGHSIEALVQVSLSPPLGIILAQVDDETSNSAPTNPVYTGAPIALPVFVNYVDVPAIIPPAGLTGVPKTGIALSDEIPDETFALIRIAAVRGDDADFSCITNAGVAKTNCPVFQIRFKNRATIWKYFDKNTRVSTSTETKPLPLTFFGNAGSKVKPSVGSIKATLNAEKVTEVFSEIFI